MLGATRGMGRALARAMAQRGDQLFLLGRDPEDLLRSARDLELCRELVHGAGETGVGTARCDLADPSGFGPAIDRADEVLGGFDTVVVTAGVFDSQEALEADPGRADRLLTIDFVNTVLFCEQVRARLLARGGGTLCVFSSVAGERGRKPVVLYGAAKAGLTHYLEGLDHRWRLQGLRTACVKPGYVKTGMTAQLPPAPFAGEPEQVARHVLSAIDRGRPVVYTPGIWRWIMLVIRNLPRFAMRRLGF